MKRILTILFSFIVILSVMKGQKIETPDNFLGYELGTQFTYHHKAVEYCKYLAEVSPNVEYKSYGSTNEGRPLGVCFVSSEDNLKNLEQLRINNLIRTGLSEGELTGRQIPFIWLGYNVHGNESAGMEAAIKTLYTLASVSYEGTEDWLANCVIIIDPCQNPDGRDLYAHRYRSSQNIIPNPDPNAWEHNQGWPGARTNHYLFDLNRDWAWQTQTETEQRISLYRQYMPQVFADFHEMGADSPFFFAPGADPWHEVLTPWQHEFHKLMGLGNAKLFDEKFRLYFTKESFDLFCPSFGDTWPLFNGAMGFTYEQGGGGNAGLAIDNEAGDTLTLTDRIEGHFLASMATIKVSYENRERLIDEFNRFFRTGLDKPIFEYESVIIKGDNEKSALTNILKLLDKNQIRYCRAGNNGKTYKAFDYLANKEGEVKIAEDDILVSARQPQSHLVNVMFEPDSKYTDSLSYDLTAWALPYVYNIKAYAVKERIQKSEIELDILTENNTVPEEKPYAYIADYQGFNEIKFMAALLKDKIRLRNMLKTFSINDKDFKRGSLIIARGDNLNLKADFDKKVVEEATAAGIKLYPVSTGMVQKGKDLGSNYSNLKYRPDIALVGGEGVSTGGFGELWYFLERELEYPFTIIGLDYLSTVNLTEYDVILLPSGSYSKQKEELTEYVKDGGRLVVFEDAIKLFAAEESTNLYKAVEARKKEKEKDEDKLTSSDTAHLKKFENQRRERLKERSAGSIYRVGLDDTHPYAFGLGKEWFMMKTASDHYPFLAKGNNIAYILNNEPVAGFAGNEFQDEVKNTITVASENIGRGEVIYITDSPYYRAYWKSGRILLGNILFR